MSTPISAWCFIGSGALSYIAMPPLLRGMRVQIPEVYKELGEPTFSKVFSRDPTKLKLQFRFIWFVVSGKAFSRTHGSVRVAAAFAWVAYIGAYLSLVFLIGSILSQGGKP